MTELWIPANTQEFSTLLREMQFYEDIWQV